jgi:hypothetical protein
MATIFFTVIAIMVGIVGFSYLYVFLRNKQEEKTIIIEPTNAFKEEERLLETQAPVVSEVPVIEEKIEYPKVDFVKAVGLLNQEQVNQLKKRKPTAKKKAAPKKAVKNTTKRQKVK